MPGSERLVLRNAALVVATALLAIACSTGGGGSQSPAASTPAATETAAPSSPSATASSGGRYGGGASATPTAAPTTAGASHEVKVASNATVGQFLTGDGGKTLYVFDHDATGATTSACSGPCASNWPAFLLGAGDQVKAGPGVTGTLAAVTRSDGNRHVAYKGRLLYYFAGDTKPGDTMGDGFGGIWHAAKP